MPTGNKVEITLCLTDGTKLTRIEDLADITTFLEQHEEYVKVKHGRWLKNGDKYCECSVCHHEGNISGQDNYCWYCGAKMDLDEVENG